jgi:GNAT superfamily N-acetyltransferase
MALPWLETDRMLIREARSGDFPELMVLYRQLQPEDPVLDNGADRTVFEEILAREGLHLLVLDDGDGTLLASCYLNLIPNITRSASPYAVIENVISRESHRGMGFGKAVLLHALDRAWSFGCYKVMLQTGSRRESTHAFYRACGFSGTDKTGYVARPPEAAD